VRGNPSRRTTHSASQFLVLKGTRPAEVDHDVRCIISDELPAMMVLSFKLGCDVPDEKIRLSYGMPDKSGVQIDPLPTAIADFVRKPALRLDADSWQIAVTALTAAIISGLLPSTSSTGAHNEPVR